MLATATALHSKAKRCSSNHVISQHVLGTHLKPGHSIKGKWDNSAPKQKMNCVTALNQAMDIAMENDSSCIHFGEDVKFGGVFRCSVGLVEKYGNDRVFNAPICEQGIIGFGIGTASMGLTTIAEIQFADYILPAFDQICNEAAKFRFRSGGHWDCGKLTIRTASGAVGHGGLYHSQSIEPFFAHAAGLKLVVPRGPFQAKGLLLSSIRDKNPVLFQEPKILYRAAMDEVPVGDYSLELGKAEVVKTGTSATVLSWGAQVHRAMQAIEMLEQEMPGVSVELIDLQSIIPWDKECIEASVRKTGKFLITHEAPRLHGFGAEIAAYIGESCLYNLKAPITRVCGLDTPFPMVQEPFYIPTAYRVHEKLKSLLEA